ncbi:DUF262 domain-containing protein [Trichocoleus sp. FACHB-591]|uniref:DUF262 domain-containing protein n=1 Tax=Trichocoleus sp. FACHB-591 TaxID=2692872 RepID=UPI001681DDE8|nr:DUF262 domain-containing protein [Trichocoleus sp. FACHB-591]MBD2096819.1 DUF262 domain-containing protein [Trichocoleus sp. FACHB-591]
MSTITPHYRSVQQLLQSQSFAIDEYQREYKWEKENIDELLTDLRDKFLNCYQSGDGTQKVSTYEDYFLGSIIISKRNGKNYLVDGQQRVTSLTLLLIYLYNAAKKQDLAVVGRLEPLIFSDDYGEPSFNLDIQERLPVIEALFYGKDFNPEGKDESIQTMYARYDDIESKDLVGELGDALPHFIYWLMTKVGLIEIATDNDNYAYAIFETMNDRGKPLSPVDMLKAYLLAPIGDADQRHNANQIWKKQVLDLISSGGNHEPERDATCIKAWFRAQYADTIRDRKAGAADKDWELIGSAFHRWVRDNRGRLNLGTQVENLELISTHFTFFAKTYQLILEASRTYTKGLESVYYNAHNEFTWQNTVLLAPLCVTDDSDTVRRKIAATATYLDIWLMRRTVNYIRVGYSSTAYAMFILCRDIRGKSLSDLVTILNQKLAGDDITLDGSPSRGRTGIKGLGLNQFSRRYVYHLLARLTAYTEVNAGKPDLFDKYVDRSCPNPCDIEHIWSNDYSQYKDQFQSEQEFQDWRNGIAGLLLLPADVNRSYQDKPFAKKAPCYAQQNLYAASLTASAYQHQPQFTSFLKQQELPFKPYDQFGKTEQLERRQLVEALANCVWSPDRLQEVLS